MFSPEVCDIVRFSTRLLAFVLGKFTDLPKIGLLPARSRPDCLCCSAVCKLRHQIQTVAVDADKFVCNHLVNGLEAFPPRMCAECACA
ncbi:hypothetical protein PoB_000197700 [Plakobranchus ocellatus]|uniref:Uncharacterized protein n=1 Tax=Plakobranchus ocellatus TaxID=259542 RepID=A0AAV3Y055_9GAST|nr:hypothetical protein PoB_000197700 [Plakobranchus ocellatus]